MELYPQLFLCVLTVLKWPKAATEAVYLLQMQKIHFWKLIHSAKAATAGWTLVAESDEDFSGFRDDYALTLQAMQ